MQVDPSNFQVRASSPSASPGGRRFTRAGPGRYRPALLALACLLMAACGEGVQGQAGQLGEPARPIVCDMRVRVPWIDGYVEVHYELSADRQSSWCSIKNFIDDRPGAAFYTGTMPPVCEAQNWRFFPGLYALATPPASYRDQKWIGAWRFPEATTCPAAASGGELTY